MAEAAIYTALAVLLLGAVYTDVRWGRIFNWLTAPGFLIGLALNAGFFGVQGFVRGIEGAALALAVFLVLSIFGRMIGAGDAKLLMAVGTLLGPYLLGWSMVYGAIIGGVLALLLALSRRRLRQEVVGMGNAVIGRAFAGSRMDFQNSTSLRLPYALPLGLGVLVSVLLDGGAMIL